jgi:hypothetical protein
METKTIALFGLGALAGGLFVYAWSKGMIPGLPPLSLARPIPTYMPQVIARPIPTVTQSYSNLAQVD